MSRQPPPDATDLERLAEWRWNELGHRTGSRVPGSPTLTPAGQGVTCPNPIPSPAPVLYPSRSSAVRQRSPKPGGVSAAEARARAVTRLVRARAMLEESARRLVCFHGHEMGTLTRVMKRTLRRARRAYDGAVFSFARAIRFDLDRAFREALGGPCEVRSFRRRPGGGSQPVMLRFPLGGPSKITPAQAAVLEHVRALTTFGEWEHLRRPRLGLERSASGRRPLTADDITLWWLAGAALSCGINRSAVYRVLRGTGVFTQSRQALDKRFRVLEAAGLIIAPRPHPSTRRCDLAVPLTPSTPPTAGEVRQAAISREVTAQRRVLKAVARPHDRAFVDSLAERERRYGEECAARIYAAVAAAGTPP